MEVYTLNELIPHYLMVSWMWIERHLDNQRVFVPTNRHQFQNLKRTRLKVNLTKYYDEPQIKHKKKFKHKEGILKQD